MDATATKENALPFSARSLLLMLVLIFTAFLITGCGGSSGGGTPGSSNWDEMQYDNDNWG
ncbi:MAG: hypothetical protein KAR06_12380 [Deltaproteobacteria bacterium]|nr:hypothetical protein [Deltaproteobacteria bacterium]